MPSRNCRRCTASAWKLFCQIRRPAFSSWTCRCRSGANLTLPHVGTLEGICTARQDSPVRGGEPGSDRLPAGRARLSAAPAPLRALTPRHVLWSRAINVLSRETDRALRHLPHEEGQRLEGQAPVSSTSSTSPRRSSPLIPGTAIHPRAVHQQRRQWLPDSDVDCLRREQESFGVTTPY